MVQIIRSFTILTSLIASCVVATTTPPVPVVVTNINNMIDSAKSLENTFKGMNSVNWMVAGPTLHNGVNNLVTGMNQATQDVNALQLPLSLSDVLAILTTLLPLQNLAGQFSSTLVGRKQEIAQFPVVGTFSTAAVSTELLMLQGPAANLGKALVSVAPASMASNATAIKDAVNNAIASAIQTYSTN